ncbi:MAG: ABC transporter permease [Hyphomicrobium sp.]|nr:ABC transporter permease [Hyphomicrobium sp.]
MADEFLQALGLIGRLDADLADIVGRSLAVSLSAVAAAALLALPFGALLATHVFPGRAVLVVLVNTLMGLPPVVVGLAVYLMLSASGPMGPLQLLYTPAAMIIAQAILVFPILAALTREALVAIEEDLGEQLSVFGVTPFERAGTLLWETRAALATALLAGFGRAIAEVGAVLIVGGNIAHVTRTMTTTIALETSKGELALALALGVILILVAGLVNAAVALLKSWNDLAQPARV